MKIIKIIIVFLFFSCSDSKKEEERISDSQRDKNIKETLMIFTEIQIKNRKEEIALLSMLYEIEQDTMKNILLDYLNATGILLDLDESKKIDFEKIIDSISVKYKIDKIVIVKIICDYKYKIKEESNSEESTSEEY